MKCVVIGGLGLIGSAVARQLLDLKRYVVIADIANPDSRNIAEFKDNPLIRFCKCDIRDLPSLIKATTAADQVYHFAGELGTTEMDDTIREAIEVNIKGMINVLDACVINRVPVLFNPTKPQVWLNTYTVTKTCTENFCLLYNKLYKDTLKVVQLRYFNSYGKDQHLYPVRKIIPTFILQAMHGLPIEVFGSGEQTVDMMHVDDMAMVTVLVTDKQWTETIPDCGTGEEWTVNAVARLVNAMLDNAAGIRYLPMRRGEDKYTRLVADTKTLSLVFDNKDIQCLPFSKGLRQTVNEMRNISQAEIDKAMRFYGWK